MKSIKHTLPGALISLFVAMVAWILNAYLPIDLVGSVLIALLLGMLLNPLISKKEGFDEGITWTSKYILRIGIILAGISLSINQVIEAGKYALILLLFTFLTAFSVGYICKRVFKIDWKLSSLLSVSTAICGGTAVATVGPVIKAEKHHIAYAISATFIFDLLTVILFPWLGVLFGMTDTTFGLWVGTSVNDTSSVVAAGYAFSEVAGSIATIVKLTRTLFIVPIVLIFSWIYLRSEKTSNQTVEKESINIKKIFPWFILGFMFFVGVRSINILPVSTISLMEDYSKFFMTMALAAIGLKTSFNEVKGLGLKPVLSAIIIDISVVVVSFLVLFLMF